MACLGYECTKNGWEIGLEVCVCPKMQYIENVLNKNINESFAHISKCCPKSYVTLNEETKLSCPFDETESRACKTINWELLQDYSNQPTISLDDHCIGYSMHHQGKVIDTKYYIQ